MLSEVGSSKGRASGVEAPHPRGTNHKPAKESPYAQSGLAHRWFIVGPAMTEAAPPFAVFET